MGGNASDGPDSFQYSPEDPDEPTLTIIEAVARTKGVSQKDLDPLNDVIDADALSALFSGRRGEFYRSSTRTPPRQATLTFRYGDCDVTVQGGRVRVREV